MAFLHNKLVLATHNEGKLAEFKELLSFTDLEILSAADYALEEPLETGKNFEENAEIKASFVAAKTGCVSLADDSGLCVRALGGAPGVHTADWAKDAFGNRDFMAAMQRVEEALQACGACEAEQRSASFVSVLCLAWPEGKKLFFRGEVEGQIVWPPRGNLGFGLDGIFLPNGYECTFGEMSSQRKHGWRLGSEMALSHRARAFKQLVEKLFVS